MAAHSLMVCDSNALLWSILTLITGDALGEGVAVDAEDGGGV